MAINAQSSNVPPGCKKGAAAGAAPLGWDCRGALQRLEQARRRVELVDELVPLLDLRLVEELLPEVGVPEFAEFVAGLALLLDPGEVLELVDLLLVEVAELAEGVGGASGEPLAVGAGGRLGGELAFLGAHFGDAAGVEVHGVGEGEEDDIAAVHVVVLGGLDGADEVAHAGDADGLEAFDVLGLEAGLGEIGLAGVLVEEAEELHDLLVVDGADGVGVADVVDPRDVLVADAFDAVGAEAALVEGGALGGFAGDDADVGVLGAEEVAGGDGAGAAGGADVGAEAAVGLLEELVVDPLDGGAGHVVVPDGVAELLELVEDDDLVAALGAELPAHVVDFLDVGLGAGGGDDFIGVDGAEPLEAFLAHAFGEDGDGRACEEGAVVGAAAAVVAGGGPDGLLDGGVEVAADEAGDEAAVGGADLVGASGEVAAGEADEAGGDAGQLARELDEVAVVEEAGLRIVKPVDAEEVQGVDVLEADLLELGLDFRGDLPGILLLGERRQDDAALLGAGDGALQDLLVDLRDDFRLHCGIP